GGLPIGGYAEKSLARADTLTPVPDDVTLEQSVALTHDGKTALAVFDRAAIESGEWVLITAASGGLGTLLTQLARNAGAKVIAAARGQAKLELAERRGGGVLINYPDPGWADRARGAPGGWGVPVVRGGAGGERGGAAAEALADGGRFLGYGWAAGDFAGVDTESAR